MQINIRNDRERVRVMCVFRERRRGCERLTKQTLKDITQAEAYPCAQIWEPKGVLHAEIGWHHEILSDFRPNNRDESLYFLITEET